MGEYACPMCQQRQIETEKKIISIEKKIYKQTIKNKKVIKC